MRFVVVGAGSIGCYVGARLAAAGVPVTLVGRPRVLDPIVANGLTVSDLDGYSASVSPQRFAIAYTCAQAATGDDPIVLLTVKGGATTGAAAEIEAAFAPGTTVISLQNGVENVARARAAAPKLNFVAAMVPYNVVWPDATRVHRSTGGTIRLAHSDADAAIGAAFERAGLSFAFADDMRAIAWGKLLVNLNNPVNALSGLTLQNEFADRNYRVAWARLIREGLRVLRKAGIAPATVLPVSPNVLARVLALPTPLFRLVAKRMASVDPSARSSMADDFARGAPTEIDDLCGAIVRLGAEHGVATPANAAMQRLVTAFTGRHLSGHELLNALNAKRPNERAATLRER